MQLIYNGIDMECLVLKDFSSEMIYDATKTDYLYTKFSIEGTFLINGQVNLSTTVTSYDLLFAPGDPGGIFTTEAATWVNTAPPAAAATMPLAGAAPQVGINYGGTGTTGGVFGFFTAAGVFATDTQAVNIPILIKTPVPAVNTEVVIRQKLSQARGKLFLVTGNGDPTRRDQVLLSSPTWGSHTDVKNGPTPKLLSVERFHGDAQTFVVTFAVETYLNEADCTLNVNTFVPTPITSPLLSNRYKMTHVIDEDSYTAIFVEGEAVFRTDFIYRNPSVNPDAFRTSLFLPVPFGMQRDHIVVQEYPDATGFHYEFLDSQQKSNFAAGPEINATKISAVHRQQIITDDDILDSGLKIYEGILNRRANKAIAKTPVVPPPLPSALRSVGPARPATPPPPPRRP